MEKAMGNDFEIGRVVAVDTAQLTIELNADMKALTRSTYEHTVTVGQINSYVIVPVGAQKVVAMVTRVMMTEEAELKVDKTMVALPSARRLMKATMIGTIDGHRFRQGISVFPVLDTPVLVTRREDLDAIFECETGENSTVCEADPQSGRYCIDIGQSAVFPDYRVRIDPDRFFGKHAAILGSTGAGKSCTVATIIQSILSEESVKHAHFVILDTNGEYRSAFESRDQPAQYRVMNITADQSKADEGLVIPYWLMNTEEFARLFRAAPGVQRPVLINALSSARLGDVGPSWVSLREELISDCHRILACAAEGSWKERNSLSVICDEVIRALEADRNKDALDELIRNYPALDRPLFVENVFRDAKRAAGRKSSQDYEPLGTSSRQDLKDRINEFLGVLNVSPASSLQLDVCSADSPRYFSKYGFRYGYLEGAISRGQVDSPRIRQDCSTLLMRIYRLLEDKRFEFLFGPTDGEWPQAANSFAAFLRDILGLPSAEAQMSDEENVPPGMLPYYDRQREGRATASNVVIVDLSLLAAEVLENVTALLARIILEFLQRLGSEVSEVRRGGLPVVLVLEEAQNYIRERRGIDDTSISREVFERIAREGRKYGLSLVVASQRPSELSKTILSQCNSFIVHRLQNPEDLRYFKEIVPGVYEQMLAQLPALAQRNALVLGECVRAPALVYMREVSPKPDSHDPRFYEHWIADSVQLPDIEAICAAWEGRAPSGALEEEGSTTSSPVSEDVTDDSEALDFDPFAD
jgi:uncharacterized protein